MSLFQFFIIVVAGIPAIICLGYLLYYLYCFFEERCYNKRWDRDIKNSTWCCCKGDFVLSKECGGECETCKHFVTVEDLKQVIV